MPPLIPLYFDIMLIILIYNHHSIQNLRQYCIYSHFFLMVFVIYPAQFYPKKKKKVQGQLYKLILSTCVYYHDSQKHYDVNVKRAN